MEEGRTTGQGRGLAACWQGLIAISLAVALYVLAFPPFDLPEAAYVFAVPILLWGLFGKQFKGEGYLLFAGGWISWLFLISWLRHCTSALEIPFTGLMGWGVTAALSLVLGVFWWAWCGIALALVRRVRERDVFHRIAAMLALAALWVVLEWLRGVVFTGFPWLPLSTSQWQRPLLLQIASLTGGAGISFVLIAFNAGLAFYIHTLWHKRKENWMKRLSLEFYLALAILTGAIAFGIHSSGAGNRDRLSGPKLGFVQPNVSVLQKWDSAQVRENLALLADLSTYAGYLGADLILWPEAPTPLPIKGNASMKLWVETLSSDLDTGLLVGNMARESDGLGKAAKWYNTVFYIDPDTGVDTKAYYAKRRLVPFGEYVPLSRLLPFVEKFVPIEGIFHGGTSARPLKPSMEGSGVGSIGNLICYEDIFPSLARANTLSGADWHYVATNNAWFGEKAGAWQHAAHSVLRAVETRRPVVRCGNAGWSGWIDEFGHIRHVMLDNTGSIYFQGVEVVPFDRSAWWSNRISPYVRSGDWFVLACLVIGLLGTGFNFFRSTGSIKEGLSQ